MRVPFALSAVAAAALVPALAWAQGPKPVLQGVYTETQAIRGSALYAGKCSHCHGPELHGDDFEIPAIGRRAFVAKWQGRSVGDAVAYIQEFMPYDAPGTLDAQSSSDLIAFIMRFSGYPAGATELPADRTALKEIVVGPPP